MAADDLRLNSLAAFAKASPRFILEEHSHCEVPAGCGGVVLRWIDPTAGLPVALDFFHQGRARLAIDGVPVTTANVLLPPGRHVLAIQLTLSPGETQARLILAGRLKIAAQAFHETLVVHSIADGSWLFTTARPPKRWMTDPDLPTPAPTWNPLESREVAEPRRRSRGAWAFRRASRFGGQPIGTPALGGRRRIHVRTVFTVPQVSS